MINQAMADAPRYWLALHPDVRKPIGGVKQMHRLAEAITANGRQATLIQSDAAFHPGWFSSDVNTVSLGEWKKGRSALDGKRDVLVLPETFLNAFSSYAPGLPKIVLNQNGAYSFGPPGGGAFPSPAKVLKLYSHPELLHVLCVSKHDQRLLTEGFGIADQRVSRLLNGIETTLFCPARSKRRQIAYMPRKNGADASAVAAMLNGQAWMSKWELVPIADCTQPEVAKILQESLLFLAFGHPEGFGLPMAEALACGCALLGYSGLGGRELIALAEENDVGLEVAFGDWQGFIDATKAFVQAFEKEPQPVLDALLKCSKAVRQRYGADAMQTSVSVALSRWESQLSPSV